MTEQHIGRHRKPTKIEKIKNFTVSLGVTVREYFSERNWIDHVSLLFLTFILTLPLQCLAVILYFELWREFL